MRGDEAGVRGEPPVRFSASHAIRFERPRDPIRHLFRETGVVDPFASEAFMQNHGYSSRKILSAVRSASVAGIRAPQLERCRAGCELTVRLA